MNGRLDIRAVADRRDRDAFLRVPFGIFKDDRQWVAPLFLERGEHIDPAKNPYFEHADAQLFLALRDGVPVGRISAQVDRLRLDRYRDATGQFGFLDAIDDRETFAALTSTAERWLKARGMRRVQGPFSFSINDETGLLIEGFDTPPSMMMGHARPYYAGHVEALGYVKAKDVIAYDYDARISPPRAMQAMVDRAKKSGNLTLRTLSKKNLARDLRIIIDIFNDAWSNNWGFVPMTEAEVAALGKNLKLLVKEHYIAIAEYRGQPAAMAVSLPDINGWIADLNGRLMPFGWSKLAWRVFMQPPAAVRIPLMGVKKAFHGTATGSALALAVIDSIRTSHLARGTDHAELSWILEDNLPIRRMIESLGAKPYKTYRVYEKALA